MKNLKIPVKIHTKVSKIRNLAEYQKLKKMAISQNRSHLFDTRPLKKEGYDKLKNYLAPLPWKALDAIISGEDLPKGIKLCHLEPIIRFLITELGWRQGQPSKDQPSLEQPASLDEGDDKMETSMG